MSQTNPRTYAVVSHGITENAERTVLKTVQIKWVPKGTIAVDYAVFSKEMLDLKGGYIYGPAGSTTGLTVDHYGSIEDYYLPDEDSLVNKIEDWWTPGGTYHEIPEVSYPDPVFPDYPTPEIYMAKIDATQDEHNTDLVLNESKVYQIDEINIESSSRVTIDVGNKDVKLIVNNLKVPQGHIIIKGSGTLKLYINNMDIGGGGDTVINHPDPPNEYMTMAHNQLVNSAKDADVDDKKKASENFEMYYYGSNDVNIDNNISLYGSLIVKEAILTMDNSGDYVGGIVAGGDVNIKGNAKITTPLLYAPNSTVNVSGGQVNGPVIGNSVSLSGNSEVNYTPGSSHVPIPGSEGSGEANLTEGVAREQ